MKVKLLISLIVIILAIFSLVAIFKQKPTRIIPSVTTTITPVEVTTEESYLLDNTISGLIDEELATISGELTEFNTGIEEDISSDISQFYYD